MDSGDNRPKGRRVVRRNRVRAELIAIALDLFRRKGYDQTTISDVVEAAGLSPRTFFRYFNAKDDLALDWMDSQGEFGLPVLDQRPADEPALLSMREMFLALAAKLDREPQLTHFRTHLIFDTPALRGRYYLDQLRWEAKFIEQLLLRRKLDAAATFELRVQVSIAIAAYIMAIRSWAERQGDGSLRSRVDQAFRALMAAAESAASST